MDEEIRVVNTDEPEGATIERVEETSETEVPTEVQDVKPEVKEEIKQLFLEFWDDIADAKNWKVIVTD